LILSPYPEDYAVSCFSDSPSRIFKILCKENPKGPCKVATRYPAGEAGIEWVDKTAAYAFHHPGWVDVLVIDECQRIRSGRDVPPNVALVLDEGRHIDLEVWAVGRRPIQIPMLLRSLCQTQISFRLNSKRDVVVMEDYFGDLAGQVQSLENHEYLYHDDKDPRVYKFNKDANLIKTFS
jgi:hypothetical protein